MSERRMDAYYYGFDLTGVEAVDLILHAIACAGKAYHHTESWCDTCSPYGDCEGERPIDWIQDAANKAAKVISASHAAGRVAGMREGVNIVERALRCTGSGVMSDGVRAACKYIRDELTKQIEQAAREEG